MAKMYHGIEIEASPEKVYDALTTQKGLRGWWTLDSLIAEPSEEGGTAEFGFERRAVVFKMRIDELAPGELVSWKCVGGPKEWKGTRLRWEIAKSKNGSVLEFTHSKWKSVDEYFRMCNSTWGELMYRFKAYVEKGLAEPLFK